VRIRVKPYLWTARDFEGLINTRAQHPGALGMQMVCFKGVAGCCCAFKAGGKEQDSSAYTQP
jgi:hypothetical protein